MSSSVELLLVLELLLEELLEVVSSSVELLELLLLELLVVNASDELEVVSISASRSPSKILVHSPATVCAYSIVNLYGPGSAKSSGSSQVIRLPNTLDRVNLVLMLGLFSIAWL